ncbi:tRNA (N(6)-L-threonylcarbamoyladenosine(37)-C(2))-methylthiotransferase MtaB [Aquabacter spiritensis]|uniref:Threonylcarbamoyladenosine tRNA methylthiotransferase MtaB n=1 Tax=Aquabacter spiritensis TaxID=933073 RepID=A0A4V2UXW7_9HYPH|nr:tRNA (N(6)-L-threonylcarbamoyladenosine(37)-C(2))-methylthiotransferase MtaB [Aquabacter spiritensis]TCT05158.1 threonylcarbamoyladenosine tRNA methylthiotransferase MtaB [Aquabacter spiritensis]
MTAAAPPEATEPFEIITFGCRLNVLDSAQMRRAAGAAGLERAVIVNSCAVTQEAVRQARQAIRRVRRERPEARIIVTGCAAQTEPGAFAAMPEVDRVVGNGAKAAPETWDAARRVLDFGLGDEAKVAVDDIMAVRETALHMVDGFDRHTRAFVQVQTGCDHRCTFCIIPYGRGPSRSVPMGEIVAQIRRLVETGHAEAVLTGVDLTSYGADLPGAPTLGRLVRAILRHVPDLKRLRLSSIDTVEIDAELMRALAEEPRLMPHLHLSLQAGDDMILKRMKRRHARADALRLVDEMRRLRPDLVFGADLIAGFPTETEAMFRNTLDLVEACGLAFVHAFPFSPRAGTPAARMPQVPREVVKDRARRLRDKGAQALQRHLSGAVGARRSILVEIGGGGRTEHFTPVRLARAAAPGTLLEARIAGHDGARLIAA